MAVWPWRRAIILTSSVRGSGFKSWNGHRKKIFYAGFKVHFKVSFIVPSGGDFSKRKSSNRFLKDSIFEFHNINYRSQTSERHVWLRGAEL